MRLKMGLNLTLNYSLNFNSSKRDKKKIKFIILHYTGMKKESHAIKKLCDPKSKVSSHYYIKTNGEILNLVPDFYEAWHAGKSRWKNYDSLNKYSLGIEMTNPGHQHGYKNFTSNQIKSLKRLLIHLMKKYKIGYKFVLGHSDISPDRKKDPGEKFPWHILARNKLSWWHKLSQRNLKKIREKKLTSKKDQNQFIKNLKKIGYTKKSQQISKLHLKYLVIAFQRRFRQSLINGKIDKECFEISKSLLNS